MTQEKLSSWVRSTAIAVTATAVMLAILIVAAEEIPALKGWLKQTFYHHWLGKGALATAAFIILSVALRIRRDTQRLSTILYVEVAGVALASVVIVGFFLLHTLKLV